MNKRGDQPPTLSCGTRAVASIPLPAGWSSDEPPETLAFHENVFILWNWELLSVNAVKSGGAVNESAERNRKLPRKDIHLTGGNACEESSDHPGTPQSSRRRCAISSGPRHYLGEEKNGSSKIARSSRDRA